MLPELTGKYCRFHTKLVEIVYRGVLTFIPLVWQQSSLSEKTSWTWVLDCLDISQKSRFCSSWMEQKALCVSELIASSARKATVSPRVDNVEQAVVNSPGLPSMQTAFAHIASLYIMRWLHRIYRASDVLGCQGQENRAVRWEMNVRDERRTTVLLMWLHGGAHLVSKLHALTLDLSLDCDIYSSVTWHSEAEISKYPNSPHKT